VNITYTASVAAVASTTPTLISGSMANHMCAVLFFHAWSRKGESHA
jgi:hypothetical protein